MSDLGQKDGEKDPENEPKSSTETGNQASAGSGSGSGTHAGYVTEESYKGLQRTAEKQKSKLEKDMQDLREKLEAAATELEEAKMAVAEKAKLEKAQTDLSTSFAAVQAERDRLARQLNQQQIILAEFPDLAPLASFIPSAETDEAFKANATNFRNSLKQYLKLSTASDLSGAAPAISTGNGSTDTTTLDKLWGDVYRLAGVPGKETEYEEANAKLQEAIKKQ